jgi:hypothetical protein
MHQHRLLILGLQRPRLKITRREGELSLPSPSALWISGRSLQILSALSVYGQGFTEAGVFGHSSPRSAAERAGRSG